MCVCDCQVFNDSFEATFTGSASEPSKRLSHVTHFKVLVDRLTSSPVFAEKMTACTTTAGLVHVINAVYSAMAQQLMDAAGPARAAMALEVSCMVRDDVCAGCRSGSPLPCPDSTRGRCVCVSALVHQGVTLVHKHVCAKCHASVSAGDTGSVTSIAAVSSTPADPLRYPSHDMQTGCPYLLQSRIVDNLSMLTPAKPAFRCGQVNCGGTRSHPLSIPTNLRPRVAVHIDEPVTLLHDKCVIDVGRATRRLGTRSMSVLVRCCCLSSRLPFLVYPAQD